MIPIGVQFTDVDGGANCAPNILTPTTPPEGSIGLISGSDMISVSATDCEMGTLFLRVFRGTDIHQPPIFNTSKGLAAEATVEFIFSDTNWCDTSTTGLTNSYYVIVADRPFDENGLDPTNGYRAVTENGKSDTAVFVGTCP